MRVVLFAGLRFFLRHRISSLITALAMSVPLLVAVLGLVTDQASRPSAELQIAAKVGAGSGLILPLVSDPTDTNAVSPAASEMMRSLGAPAHQVDLILDVDAVVVDRAVRVNIDQRDWSADTFSTMLTRIDGRLPTSPTEGAVSSAFAREHGVGIGQTLQVAGSTISVVGTYDRPFALNAEVVFVSRQSELSVQSSGAATVVKQFVVDEPLDASVAANLNPDLWLYLSGPDLVTKSSVLTKAPVGYAAVLVIGFLGLIWGAWSLSGRRRRAASQIMIELGASRVQMIGASWLEAALAALLGAAIAGAILAVAGPAVHRSVAAAAGIANQPGWFPWRFTVIIAGMVGVAVLVAATAFELRLLRSMDEPRRHTLVANETAKLSQGDRSLEYRTRRATPSRLRTTFGWVALTTLVVTVTGILWSTTNHLDESASPGTRRPGDVEIFLRNGKIPDVLQTSFAELFPGPVSVVRVAEWPAQNPATDTALAGAVAPADTYGANMIAPLQVIVERDDWLLLTGQNPTDGQWEALTNGQLATFIPELAGQPTVNLVGADSLAIRASDVPAFPVSADAVTLNRAKGAVSPNFMTKFGLAAQTQALIVHTDRTDSDQLEEDVSAEMGKLGIAATDIRIGRPFEPDPPLIVVILTLGGAVLAIEQTVFACLSVVADERRTLRLLSALGAGYRRRLKFIFGVAGLVAAAGAAIGGLVGVVVGSLVSSAFSGVGAVSIPTAEISWLVGALLLVAGLTSAAASLRVRIGGIGSR